MCLREILLTANSSVTRQLGGKDSAGMGQSSAGWMFPGHYTSLTTLPPSPSSTG